MSVGALPRQHWFHSSLIPRSFRPCVPSNYYDCSNGDGAFSSSHPLTQGQPFHRPLLHSTSTMHPCFPQHQQRHPASLASEIINRLYISDLATAESYPALTTLGITHVISVMPGFVALPPTLGLIHIQIPIDDFPFSELAAHLPASTQFLKDALADPRARVLVHCAEGVSRSVSVVSAFLIATRGMTPVQAVQYVKSRRRVADPNSGFVAQLHEYAERLQGGSGSSNSG
jgi:protein-tyrosine phosphatase